jgi:hypothetical protein
VPKPDIMEIFSIWLLFLNTITRVYIVSTALFIPDLQKCVFFTSTYSRYGETTRPFWVVSILAIFPTHSGDDKIASTTLVFVATGL